MSADLPTIVLEGDEDFLVPDSTGGDQPCRAENPGDYPYVCTRTPGPEGDHAAHAEFPVGLVQVSRWSTETAQVAEGQAAVGRLLAGKRGQS